VPRGVAHEVPRRGDRDVGRTEDRAKRLLKRERHAPGGEQALQRALVEPLDDAALQHRADQRSRDERHRKRSDEVVVKGAALRAKHGGENRLRHVGRVGADHHDLAVRHVDHAHQTVGDGEAQRGDEQHGAEAEAAEKRAEKVHPEKIVLRRGDRAARRLDQRRRHRAGSRLGFGDELLELSQHTEMVAGLEHAQGAQLSLQIAVLHLDQGNGIG